jgi:hypothetical protein
MHRKYHNAYHYISDSDADDDVIAAVGAAAILLKRRRRISPIHKRLNWTSHVKQLISEKQFSRMFWMKYASFIKLFKMLSPMLQVDPVQGSRRSRNMGHVSAELIIHCLLRYLAGGSHHDIRVLAGIGKSTFFTCLHRAIDAVNKCNALALSFPQDAAGLKELALDFQSKSSNGTLDGCVGALDGWLCRIKVPLGKDTSNIASYYSGHYQCHGVNIQAVCDARCRFTYMSCRSPGGTGDSRAFQGTALNYFLQEIPRGFYVVGDSAYTLSSSLLVPYSGAVKKRKDNDVFNFHLSQLRIKIEQAFGFLVNKWRVFKKPLEVNLRRVPTNYCV